MSLHGKKGLVKKNRKEWWDNIFVHLKKFTPYSKINGMLNVILNIREFRGGLQKALTIIKWFREQIGRVSF